MDTQINVLINEENLNKIDLYFYKDENGKTCIQPEKKSLEDGTYVLHNVWFKTPNYQDTVTILSNIFKSSTSDKINPIEDGLIRALILVKKWTFKDADKKDIPCTQENIKSLQPYIGSFISSRIIEMSEAD